MYFEDKDTILGREREREGERRERKLVIRKITYNFTSMFNMFPYCIYYGFSRCLEMLTLFCFSALLKKDSKIKFCNIREPTRALVDDVHLTPNTGHSPVSRTHDDA